LSRSLNVGMPVNLRSKSKLIKSRPGEDSISLPEALTRSTSKTKTGNLEFDVKQAPSKKKEERVDVSIVGREWCGNLQQEDTLHTSQHNNLSVIIT
jgi:hypothetical protein